MSPAGTQVKVLVVDDDPMIVSFLRTGLRYEGFVVAEARDGAEALQVAAEFKPDLVVLDLMMPGIDGYEVCRRLRGDPHLGILMLTAKDEVQDRVAGLDLGADDYIVKPFDFDELLSRMQAILRRLRPEASTHLVAGPITVDVATRRVQVEEVVVDLTGREFDLLVLLMRQPGQVFSRQTILDRVWGTSFYGGETNVEVYIGYLRHKLGAHGPKLIRTVRGIGYRLAL
ncbi:MAG: response regulator transcription factor [Candidatus Dormibacteria bacterium]